jgi:fructose PTS system EIIBC or EIIC component
MADRPGLVPGIVGGLIANVIGAGFLGGLVSGLLAGGIAYWMTRIRVPRAVAGVMPVVVIPLVSSLVVGFLMLVFVGRPIAAATKGLENWLSGLSGSNAVLLGILLGLMMAFDMGGPVNKTAYTFALAGLASGNQTVMAAVMAAGMVPPIALALATVLRPKVFTKAERVAGEAAWLLGASFITEGAIPFAAADPLRVIPPIMLGSAVTGGLSMAMHVGLRAPHGGIFVLFAVTNILGFLLALLIGVLVAAAGVILLKSLTESTEEIDSLSYSSNV